MKVWTKNALCISLSLLCLFTCIGYAYISDSLAVSGNVELEVVEPEGIYISKVSVYSVNGISSYTNDIILPTNLLQDIQSAYEYYLAVNAK